MTSPLEAGVQAVWSIGLIGALVATLLLLKEVALLLRVLGHIRIGAESTRDAAQRLAANAAAVSRLAAAEDPADELREANVALASAAGALDAALDALPQALRRGR